MSVTQRMFYIKGGLGRVYSAISVVVVVNIKTKNTTNTGIYFRCLN